MGRIQNNALKLNQPYQVALLSLNIKVVKKNQKPYLVQMENIEHCYIDNTKRPFLTIVYGNKSTHYFNPIYKRYSPDILDVITLFVTDLDGVTAVNSTEVIARLHFRPVCSL